MPTRLVCTPLGDSPAPAFAPVVDQTLSTGKTRRPMASAGRTPWPVECGPPSPTGGAEHVPVYGQNRAPRPGTGPTHPVRAQTRPQWRTFFGNARTPTVTNLSFQDAPANNYGPFIKNEPMCGGQRQKPPTVPGENPAAWTPGVRPSADRRSPDAVAVASAANAGWMEKRRGAAPRRGRFRVRPRRLPNQRFLPEPVKPRVPVVPAKQQRRPNHIGFYRVAIDVNRPTRKNGSRAIRDHTPPGGFFGEMGKFSGHRTQEFFRPPPRNPFLLRLPDPSGSPTSRGRRVSTFPDSQPSASRIQLSSRPGSGPNLGTMATPSLISIPNPTCFLTREFIPRTPEVPPTPRGGPPPRNHSV